MKETILKILTHEPSPDTLFLRNKGGSRLRELFDHQTRGEAYLFSCFRGMDLSENTKYCSDDTLQTI